MMGVQRMLAFGLVVSVCKAWMTRRSHHDAFGHIPQYDGGEVTPMTGASISSGQRLPSHLAGATRLLALLLTLLAVVRVTPAQPGHASVSARPGVTMTAWNYAPEWRRQTVFVGEVVSARLQSAVAAPLRQPGPGAGPLRTRPSMASPSTRFSAQVRVVRMLQGNLQPGATVALDWPFPQPPGAGPSSAEPVTMSQHAVFFLDEQGQPLLVRFPGAPAFLGGYLLPLPAETAVVPKEPVGGRTPVEAALLAEVLAAIQFWAAASGPQLDQAAVEARPGAWYPSVVAGHFQQAISLMAEVDPSPLRQQFTDLLQSPSVHVRMVGIQGLLHLQDFAALRELERDYAAYHRAMRPVKFQQALRAWALSASPRAIDVAGRLAIHEDMEASLETAFAQGLAQARVPDTLPYLVTLLGSPHASTRMAALQGLCALTSNKGIYRTGDARSLQRPALLARYVPPAVANFCPDAASVQNAQQEQEIQRFWREWWFSTQAAIASDFRRNERGEILVFPAAPAPLRWLDQTKPVITLLPGGPRVALHQLLYPFRPNSLGDGDPVVLLKRLLTQGAQASDADWSNCARILRDHAVILQRIDEDHSDRVRQALATRAAAGSPAAPVPTLESVEASKQRVTDELLDSCLRQMEQHLSTKGWSDFQEMLKQRAAGQRGYQSTAPPRPR